MNPDLPGLLAFAAAAALAAERFVRSGPPRWWQHGGLFALLLAAALFSGQRDALRANFQIWNPDESQLIAGALVLAERPVFWRDVDGTTHGPLAQYPLLLPALLGARLDYTSARLVGAGLTVLLLLALQRALAVRLDEGAARLLVLPGWAWLAFNRDPELAQYTTELMPSLLLALAAWPVTRLLTAGTLPAAAAFFAGTAAGAAPFAKLQAAPLALWVLGCALVAAFRAPPPDRRRLVLALVGGAVLPALILVLPAAAAGAFEDFRIRYLAVNLLGYVAGGGTWFNRAAPTPDLLFGFDRFLWPVLAGLVAAAGWSLLRRSPPSGRMSVFTFGLVLTAAAAIYLPQKPFGHYFLLGAGPLLLLLGTLAEPGLARLRRHPSAAIRATGAALLVLGLAAPAVVHRFQHPDYFRSVVRTRPPLDRALIEAVQRHTTPGGGLAVWGWQPGLYVFTQTLSATPDLIVFWQIVPSPWRDFYRARYLRDFAARPPAVFVDTTGPADFFFYRDAAGSRHENFPALRDLVARDYMLADTVAGARIYVRNGSAGPPAGAL